MQKLLMAMVGHGFVQVTTVQDLEDSASKGVVKELLKTGKAYSEIQQSISIYRNRSDHNRLSEALLQCVEIFLDGYVDILVKAEQDSLRGNLNLLRLRWLVSPYTRAFPDVIQLLKRSKKPEHILRNLAEERLSVSPAALGLFDRSLETGIALLADAVSVWVNKGRIQPGSEGYFFVVDEGSLKEFNGDDSRSTNNLLKDKYSLHQYKVAMDRVPIDLKLSLEWASRVCSVGSMRQLLLDGVVPVQVPFSSKQQINVLNEAYMHNLFRQMDESLRKDFFSRFPQEMKLIRDSFFLGRGELFRVAMDTKGDFEDACVVSQSLDIRELVTFQDSFETISSLTCPIVASGIDLNNNRKMLAKKPNSWFVFKQKSTVKNGFDLQLSSSSLFASDNNNNSFMYIGLDGSTLAFANSSLGQSQLPSLCVQFSKMKCVLFLDGLFVQENVFHQILDEFESIGLSYDSMEARIMVTLNQEEEQQHILIDFAFEDALIKPKWMDCHGRSFCGVIASQEAIQFGELELTVPVEDATTTTTRDLLLPYLAIRNNNDRLLPWDVYENLNGAFQTLFTIKATQELLSQAWTLCKRDENTNAVRYQMAQLCSLLYLYLQLDVIDVGFAELSQALLKNNNNNNNMTTMMTLEYIQSYTKFALEQIAWKCGLNNLVIKETILEVLSICELFALSIMKGASKTVEALKSSLVEFHQVVEKLLLVLKASSSQQALELYSALDMFHGVLTATEKS